MIPVLVIVTALLISSISVLTPHALAQTSPHAVSTNMTSGNTTSTDSNNTNATMTATAELDNKKTFYVFSEEMEGINETKLGIPGDVYSPSVLAVNEGDTVTMHFYNLDPSDRHTFTMAAPYNINSGKLTAATGQARRGVVSSQECIGEPRTFPLDRPEAAAGSDAVKGPCRSGG